MFPPGTKASEYTYGTIDRGEYHGDKFFVHPLWNENSEDRTGYDFAIVRLKEAVTDAGSQPALYAGLMKLKEFLCILIIFLKLLMVK